MSTASARRTTNTFDGRCPVCVEANVKSKVFDRGTVATLLGWHPFYDEDGVHHSHDLNRRKTAYQCSNGHSFGVEKYQHCPNCDWRRDEVTLLLPSPSGTKGVRVKTEKQP